MIRQKIVAGNWKMNGSKASIHSLVSGLLEMKGSNSEIVIAPPFPYLSQINDLLDVSCITVAAQNISDQVEGAYTGEVAASMLGDFSVKYVLIGHSERRSIYNETDDDVAAKVRVALGVGLTPILCIGETLEERESNQTLDVCVRQIEAVMALVGVEAFEKIVLAYEPVWAIGTGLSASAEQAQEVHQSLRVFLAKSSERVSQKIQILYGGSVKASNSVSLFEMPDVDGALVGGASLDVKEFIAIVKAAG